MTTVDFADFLADKTPEELLMIVNTYQDFESAKKIVDNVMNDFTLTAMPPPKSKRPTWDEYYLAIAKAVAVRATCPAGQVGCIAVSPEGVPLIFGYNGAPSGMDHCDEVGCSWVERLSGETGQRQTYSRHMHAEANAVSRAARVGARLDGATLYITQEPCPDCLKLCLQAGIRTLVVGTVKDSRWFDQAIAICQNVGATCRKGQYNGQ